MVFIDLIKREILPIYFLTAGRNPQAVPMSLS